jgi:hypothetical protein
MALVPPNIQTDAKAVLHDMLEMLKHEAKTGAADAALLLKQASEITNKVMALTGQDLLQSLESIGHGCKSGLAAIANERKRAIFANIIQSSLGFASSILGSILGGIK